MFIANDNGLHYYSVNFIRIVTMKLNLLAFAVASAFLTGCGSSNDSNTAPVFGQSNHTISINEDTSGALTVAATDKDNDSLIYSLANAAANGAASIDSSSGQINYTPNANFNGEDTFQIAVSDGEDSVTATVTVTVAAVNDAPIIDMDSVIVSGGEIKNGQVNASDIDGDTLSYSITQGPANGILTIDTVSGEITYTPTDLINAEDSFELTVDDGNGGVVAKQITIGTNLATNTDRAYYYYASEMSHLKRAEALIASVKNDVNQGNVYATLAGGYAEAGLESEVNRLITEEKIIRDELRAIAFLNVANQYNLQNKLEEANELRQQANTLYTQYVASKGIANFNDDDQEFYNSLASSYQKAGELALAAQSFSVLDILLTSALDGEQTTQALRLFFGFRNRVEDTIAIWQESRNQADYDNALDMVERLHSYANMIGHRYARNNRNGNEGKPYFSTRQVALSDVIASYIALNKLEEAKPALADALALHGLVGVDENYPREPHEYAAVTHVEYPHGLVMMAPHFVNLYPNKDLNVFLNGFEESDFYRDWAKGDAEEAVLLAEVRNNPDKDAALAAVLASRDDSDLRSLFTNLISFNGSNPGAARILINQGEFEAASKFISEGLKLLTSDDYLKENIAITTFVTGITGCGMMLDQLNDLTRISGDTKYREQMIETLASCRTVALTRYAEEDGIDILKEDVINAHIDLIKYHNPLGQAAEVKALTAKVDEYIVKYSAEEIIDKAVDLGKLGGALGLGGMFSEAQVYYNQMIELVKEIETNVANEDRFDFTKRFFDYTGYKDINYAQYLSQVRNSTGSIDNYSEVYTAATQAWADLVAWNLGNLPTASLQQQVVFYPEFADQYLKLSMFDQALALKEIEVLGEVEQDSIVSNVIAHLASYDAFTSHGIATVDTDLDGKANFFAPWATEEMIANSGIELDQDSDNDGVNDDSDGYPLDPSKK